MDLSCLRVTESTCATDAQTHFLGFSWDLGTRSDRKPNIKHHSQADYLWACFEAPKWGVFCYTERLRNRPPRLKLVLSDSTRLQLCGLHPPAASLGRQAHQPAATSELFPRACAACLPSFVLRFLNITVGQIRWGIPALHHYYYLLSVCTAILC